MVHRKILRWFYTWRAWRRQKKASYAFDKRSYDGRFGPGFLAFLEKSKFYGSSFGPRRGLALFTIIILRISFFLFLILIVWMIWESIRALSLY